MTAGIKFLIFSIATLAIVANSLGLSPDDQIQPFGYRYPPIRPTFFGYRQLLFPRRYIQSPMPSFRMSPYDDESRLYTCSDRCDNHYQPDYPCQCSPPCVDNDECCHDFEDFCIFSCHNRCHLRYQPGASCQCNKKCSEFENCCPDYENMCPVNGGIINFIGGASKTKKILGTCAGKCGRHDPKQSCNCNTECVRYKDCCNDYKSMCLIKPTSCYNRCQKPMDSKKPCQCNAECKKKGDCCGDYKDLCDIPVGPPGNVTDKILSQISEELVKLDKGMNLFSMITVQKQAKAKFGEKSKRSPLPLPFLVVNPNIYKHPTISKLLLLHDNYEPDVWKSESKTEEKKREQTSFVDSVLSTPVMKRTAEFLQSVGLVTGNFRQTFERIWFGLYSRANGILGSCGFEHVFLGELKSGNVSGFHHWAFMAREEANENLDYYGYVREIKLGSKGLAISEQFDWKNAHKPISSIFVGLSPELELGLYTICWYARPNELCPVVISGGQIDILTYDITFRGQKYVATAYPNL